MLDLKRLFGLIVAGRSRWRFSFTRWLTLNNDERNSRADGKFHCNNSIVMQMEQFSRVSAQSHPFNRFDQFSRVQKRNFPSAFSAVSSSVYSLRRRFFLG